MTSVRYNPPQQMIFRTRLLVTAAALVFLLHGLLSGAQAANWEQPVGALATQIASLAGPGPVQLVVRNRSSLSPDQIPPIQTLLEQDLRAFGVIAGGSDSPTMIRVTLSENLRGGLWVAEVQEGTEARVTMLPVKLDVAAAPPRGPILTLQRTILITEPDPVLDAQMFPTGGEQRLVVLEPTQIVVYARSATPLTPVGTTAAVATAAWTREQTFPIPNIAASPRDMRGQVVAGQDEIFDAYLPGMLCRGSNDGPRIAVQCADSDDPWPVTKTQKAFYDSARDYFMGVLAPGFGMRLTPFYAAAEVPRAGGSATLLNNVDGSAVLIENNLTEPVNGANDWGSDLTTIHSACGSGTQVLVSGSGAAAASDSLRAYELPGREAIPVSAPMQVPGTVTAIWPASGGNNATVVVHKPGSVGNSDKYEVWSVAASCN